MKNRQDKDNRVNILGVMLHPMTLDRAVDKLSSWIEAKTPGYANFCNVNSIMACFGEKGLRGMLNNGLALTDGMPLVWLCRLLGHKGATRVYGPDLMLALCKQGADKRFRHFFYGGQSNRADLLANRLRQKYPGLIVAGTHCPPLLAIGEMEDPKVIERINAARPDIVWVGLGAPKQDFWVANHRHLIDAPVLAAVGAAFDFHAGTLRQAPTWMQKNGLEWLFRLFMEPRRLGFRYLIYNPFFIMGLFLQFIRAYKFQD